MQSENHGYWSRRAEKSFWLMRPPFLPVFKMNKDLALRVFRVGDLVDRKLRFAVSIPVIPSI